MLLFVYGIGSGTACYLLQDDVLNVLTCLRDDSKGHCK